MDLLIFSIYVCYSEPEEVFFEQLTTILSREYSTLLIN